MSSDNARLVVADSWDDADADPVKEIMDKMEKVKILQRKEEKKEAFFEKVKLEESGGSLPKLQVDDRSGPYAEKTNRKFLRRPKDGFVSETVNAESSSPSSAASASEDQEVSRSRPQQKNSSKEPKPTFEERQAAYQAARARILGTEYQPNNQEIKEIKFIDRSKSPETLKMTEKNMVAHYGEELSKELMQQPEPTVPTPEEHFMPDFTFQQPPPSLISQDNSRMYAPSCPPGYQHPQNHYPDNSFYPPINGPQYAGQFQQNFVPNESSTISSSSQNSNMGIHNEQEQYYIQQHQQFQNCVPYNMSNMSYPPPNFQGHLQNSQIMSNQMNQQQICQNQQFQMPNGGGAPPMNYGVGRGQNGMMYPSSGHVQMMFPQQQTGQNYGPRNGGNGQQRQFQQQQGRSQGNQTNQNKKLQNQKNGKSGVNNCPTMQPMQPMQNPMGQIPFGCPPPQVRDQYSSGMPPNNGVGILGPAPFTATQWTGPPPNNRSQNQ